MIKRMVFPLALGLALSAIVAGSQSVGTSKIFPVSVQVAPQTMILDADQSGSVTVHVGIKYSFVDEVPPAFFTLQGVGAFATFADARGELVCKFSEAAIKNLYALDSPAFVRMVLRGWTEVGVPFYGGDVVRLTPLGGGE